MRRVWLAPAALLAGATAIAVAQDTGPVTVRAPEASARSAPPDAAPGVPVMPEVVVRRLSREGYYGFRRIAREGGRYVVHAYDPQGRFMRVVADAGSGRILGAHVLAATGTGQDPP